MDREEPSRRPFDDAARSWSDEERVDLAIDRIVDAEETREEWSAFVALAERAPERWRVLAERQRDARRLGVGLERAVGEAAIGAALPVVVPLRTARHRRALLGARFWLRGGGWVAAASLAIAWCVTAAVRTTPVAPERGSAPSGSLMPIRHATVLEADAPLSAYLDAYLDLGRRDGLVLGELPTKLLIESRELESGGGFEVLFVRPIVERRIVPALFGFDRGEGDVAARIVPVGTGGI